MTGNILIPNIEKKIDRVLRRLQLTPNVTPHDFLERVRTNKHRYFTAARTADGVTVAFYARLHNNPDAQRKFLTEIAVLGSLNRLTAAFAQAVPKLFNHGRERDFEWFVREYIVGAAIGHSRKLEQRLAPRITPQLVDAIYGISQLQPKKLGVRLPAFNPHFYAIDQQCYGLARETKFPAATCQAIAQLVQRNHRLLVTENRYLSHGDLNLGNILICDQPARGPKGVVNPLGRPANAGRKRASRASEFSADGRVRIVDWELAQHNNFAYDIGYLWVHLWQAPRAFRHHLMQHYLRHLGPTQRQRFARLLPVVVAYLAIGGIPYRLSAHERKDELLRRRRYHIALLENCLKGFNRLINT